MYLFFFNDTATTGIYTLSLHDALPISGEEGRSDRQRPCPEDLRLRGGDLLPLLGRQGRQGVVRRRLSQQGRVASQDGVGTRSEEHTSELQSRQYLVCRLLLEKKKNITP